jgi:dTDP-4-amino-4,6-dideoxygalactose transaminase
MQKNDFIKIFEPSPPNYKDLKNFLKIIEDNGWFTNFGPLHDELIDKFSAYFGFPKSQIVLFPNATLAISGAISSLKLKDKRWYVPSWTFTATPLGIIFGGGDPHFVDVDKSGRADFEGKTGNFLEVLPFGDSLRDDILNSKFDYEVIDGAASFDSLKGFTLPQNRPVGVVVSLHATKLMSTGEGGVFITNDQSWANRVRAWTRFGFEGGERISKSIGINAKFSEYQAALGLASFKNWPSHRLRITELNKKVLDITLNNGFEPSPASTKGFATPYWIIKTSGIDQKNNLVEQFSRLKIETRNWWESGCADMPAFSNFVREDMVNTKKISNELVGLPFHLNLSEKDLEKIDYALNLSR